MKVNMKTVTNGARIVANAVSQHSPTILTVVGVCCMIGAVAATIVEAPKAKNELDEIEEDDELTHKEYINRKTRIILYHYWKTAALTVGGAGIIFWGHKISLGRTAAALAAYQMSKDDLKKLEDKVIETDGEKHFNKIKDDINKDNINAHPVNYSTVINTGRGNTLCYDPIAHDYFWSDLDYIDKMARLANEEMTKTRWGMCKSAMSYDSWREYLDLPPLDGNVDEHNVAPAIGKDLGWFNTPIELYKTCMPLADNTVVHVIGFTKSGRPKWFPNIDDRNGEDISDPNYTDDETDMPWRT